ncbi:hypothetical protein Tco_0810826 [Tanacetum coccineum]
MHASKRKLRKSIKAWKKLSHHYIKDNKARRPGNDKPKKAGQKWETSDHDKAMEILMIQPWQKEKNSDGRKGPMIIVAEIGGHFIHRIYVDGGSASEILYEHCFNRLRPEVKSQMIPATTPLIGFSGEVIWPMRQILLLVKIGDLEHSTSTWMNFVVVRSPSPHNGIIRRPVVKRILAE